MAYNKIFKTDEHEICKQSSSPWGSPERTMAYNEKDKSLKGVRSTWSEGVRE